MSDEFAHLVGNVKPIKSAQASKLYSKKGRKSAKIDNAEAFIHAPISQNGFDIKSEDELYFCRSSSNSDILRKMAKGQIAPLKTIDLHGMTITEAEIYIFQTIDNFHSSRQNVLRIVHGKGYSSNANDFPKMKNFVARYLSQHPRVQSFVSCPAQYGGTGAVYVLIQKNIN